jgi:hypothetical protein
VGNPTKEWKSIVCTSSNSRYFIKPISHGLFPLKALLFASERAFSAFFALASADLVDVSTLALAAVAASKAFLEASSSASSDEMRALAIAKASIIQKGRESQLKQQRKALKTSKVEERRLPSEAFVAFKYSTHLVPKLTNFFIKPCQKNT